MDRRWFLAGCAVAVVLGSWLLLGTGGEESATTPGQAAVVEPEQGGRAAPLLKGRGQDVRGGEIWLTVALVESPEDRPLAGTELLFMLRRSAETNREVRFLARTDAQGLRRIGPLARRISRCRSDPGCIGRSRGGRDRSRHRRGVWSSW